MSESNSHIAAQTRYSLVAIGLHWIIAIFILGLLIMGFMMGDLRAQAINGDISFDVVQAVFNWHKTIGICVLVLSLLRLTWRLTHKPPALPQNMKSWEKLLARGTHTAFYGLMIGLPIGGWMSASATRFPTKLFNQDSVLLPRLPVPQSEAFYELASSAHAFGAYMILLVLALHIIGALKHHILERDGVLTRMIPGLNIPAQKLD